MKDFLYFFQAEDGIRDVAVTGVQTCALPIFEVLKQDQFVPMPMEQQVMIIYAGTSGALDDLPLDSVKRFEADFLAHMAKDHPAVGETIRQSRKMEAETEERLKKAIADFKAA